jgi:hypothetical protein
MDELSHYLRSDGEAIVVFQKVNQFLPPPGVIGVLD